MRKLIIFVLFCMLITSLFALQEDVKFTDSWNKHGYSIEEQGDQNLKLNFSINNFSFEDVMIDNENLTNIQLFGVFLPNDEGMPNLPGIGQHIAIPQGAKAELQIIDYRIETYSNIEIAPAPRIPLDTETGPLDYSRNTDTYSRNENYPANFIQLSKPFKMRGVDVVMLGITPFQYNPVSKELIVYRDIKFEISFSGGTRHFGEDRLRNRWWDPIIKDAVINYTSLPQIDYNKQTQNRDGAEYLIICPNDATFITWANTIKDFRQQQGISTMIVTTTEIGGNTTAAIENYVDNAYNNWSTPLVAVLLLGDYGTSGNTVMSSADFSHPYQGTYISDNVFADVDGDDLPEIAFARMTAQNSTHLANMVNKFINYENQPPTNPDFYNEPITALGWQDDRWFQVCSETVGGFWNNTLGKQTVRINELGSPANNHTSGPWSTATNTTTVMNYFGPTGLGYLPATPQELGGFTGGNATDVNNAINSGAFMLQHRDHGYELGWGEPSYISSNLSGIGNNDPVFVMSINCLTGRFDYASEVFTEAFHRMEYGALGLIAASQVSYSFVNDAYVWGLYDYMWPEFDPGYGSAGDISLLPCFGNASAKYYLQASNWPYNENDKQITYRLFHHHGDAFSTVYSEVPVNLTVTHNSTLLSGSTSFTVAANPGSFIALTVNNEIIGTADGTGSPVSITIPAQNPGVEVLVIVTKQNYYRYSSTVDVIAPSGPYIVIDSYSVNSGGDSVIEAGETAYLTVTLANNGTATATNTTMILSEIDSYINLTDNNEPFGSIAVGTSVTRTSAYTFTVLNSIPDNHPIHFDAVINSDQGSWNSNIDLTASNPANITVNPSQLDKIMPPDQTSSDNLYIGNSGGATINYTATIKDSRRVLNPTPKQKKKVLNKLNHIILKKTHIEPFVDMSYLYTSRAYCASTYSNTTDDWITNVTINTINNNTSQDGAGSYGDYTGISTDLVQGETYNLSVTFYSEGRWTEYVKVWIDWDMDEILDEAGEFYELGSGVDATLDMNITVPADATLGTTRMRVVEKYAGYPGPCDVSNYGEVEDYTINVVSSGPEWITLDGSSNVSGSILAGAGDDMITVGFNTTGLIDGVYTANIEIDSNDSDEPNIIVPVTLTVDDNSSSGSGNNSGNTSGPAVVDLPITNIGGTPVDPDVSVDPDGTGAVGITINVIVTDEIQNGQAVPNASSVIISYALDVLGDVTGITLNCVLSYDGLTDLAYIHWYNGSNWVVPDNVQWETPSAGEVSFSIVFAARDESTEIILGEDNPLPVTLSNFSTSFINSNPVIEWTTESETNNSYWNIYRSISQNFGQALHLNQGNQIDGQGTTTEPTDYSYTDELSVLNEQTYWYWVESVDFTGEVYSYDPIYLTIPEGEGDNNTPATPQDYGLHQNFPNPFNPDTEIKFALKYDSFVELTVYNVMGKKVITLLKDNVPADIVNTVNWNGQDENGKSVSSGIYLYKLQTEKKNYLKKMILMK